MVEEIGKPVVWLGDLEDTKEVIRGKVQNAWLRYFQRSKLEHYVLVGNHDYFNLECDDHALEIFKLLHNVTIIDSPQEIDGMVMIPYMHDLEKLKAVIAKYQDPKKTLIGHLEISQFDFGNGHICNAGLTLADVAGFKRVISGHFHKYQAQGNLTYLGTPFSHSFGETDQIKYLGLYNPTTDALMKAPTPFARHVTKEFDCDLLDENLSHMIFTFDEISQNNYYRVILTGTQANIDRFPRAIYDEGGTNGKMNIKWITRPSDHAENDIQIEDTVSNETQFTKWATQVKSMDEDTVKLGLAIMGACK
jgi:DNA repair exonuclease SbcCD nuclease subunit